ncbi:MAG: hypothetical protein AAB776_04565 [Patescibacteria group bacterium]
MFYLKDGDSLAPTELQVGDRIRVRPQIGKFFVWRPVRLPHKYWWVAMFQIRRAVRLWSPDQDGVYHRWLDLPKKRQEGHDVLMDIVTVYGSEHFAPPMIRWVEERPTIAVDDRFDYVATAARSNS